jgi:oxalate decarboxylase/phosphoglucose isomerase-like protein (cupin superfamily)
MDSGNGGRGLHGKTCGKRRIVVPLDFGHSWSNVSETPLIAFDDWRESHVPHDYEAIKKLHGMCFYIVNDKGIKFVPNPNYKNHPEPKVVTAKEFQKIYPLT